MLASAWAQIRATLLNFEQPFELGFFGPLPGLYRLEKITVHNHHIVIFPAFFRFYNWNPPNPNLKKLSKVPNNLDLKKHTYKVFIDFGNRKNK